MNFDDLKEAIRAALDFLPYPFGDYLLRPILGIISATWNNPRNQLHWLYIISSLLIVFLIFIWQLGKIGRVSLTGFSRFCAPKEVYTHQSAIVDYKFYVINAVVDNLIFGSSVFGIVIMLPDYLKSFLQWFFGLNGPQWEIGASARVCFTVLTVAASDLGFTIAHYLQHKLPFLWEFHKVHHSAEVLTPISNYRFHTVDSIVIYLFTSVFSGAVTGLYSYLYLGNVMEFTVINISVMYFVFNLSANLRHSHVWLSYGWRLSHVFNSPAMHQIHHSLDKRHFNKNYAQVFSLWDWLLGTIYVPREKEMLNFGLTDFEHKSYDSVWKLYSLPFKKSFARMKGRLVDAAGIAFSEKKDDERTNISRQ